MISFITPRRRTLPITRLTRWIGGAVTLWLGAVGMTANGAFWNEAGHATAASHLFGVGGLVLIVAGALIWRKS
jgi:hypothetical protein